MPDPAELLPPAENPPPPAPPRAKTPLCCEFCECQLTPTGDVFAMSDKARAHRRATETIENLKTSVATLTKERDELQTKLRALDKPAPREGRRWFASEGEPKV